MRFDSEIAPAMRKVPREKNHDDLARALLMGRDPSGGADWAARYGDRFRELYKIDDAFRALVNTELNDKALTRIQERLDAQAA